MDKISISDILTLSAAERMLLVEEIWDSLVATPEAVPVTEAQRRELERRLEAYERDPHAGAPWEEVRDRIRKAS